MAIHQLSVTYQPDHDRLLLRVRTRQAELFGLWLTRRMMIRLWQPLLNTAGAASLGMASRDATVLPEAQDMMRQALREKAKAGADFQSPFDEDAADRPLGDEPLLVAAVDIHRKTDGHVDLVLRDAQARKLSLSLTPDLLNNLMTLMEHALQQSEWGLGTQPAGNLAQAPDAPAAPRMLN